MIDPTSCLILGADLSSRNLVSILLQSLAYLINYELFLTTRDFSVGHFRQQPMTFVVGAKVSFVLDRNCWVYTKWLLHSTVARLALTPFPFQDRNVKGTVECRIQFAHTQHFLSNAKLTLVGGDIKRRRFANEVISPNCRAADG